MNKYLDKIPLYKAWNEVIEILTLKFSTKLSERGWAFKNVICDISKVNYNYSNGFLQITITFTFQHHVLSCRRNEKSTNTLIEWKYISVNPSLLNASISSKEEFNSVADLWLQLLENEL